MANRIRNLGKLPTCYVVDPKGRIRYFRVASGVEHRIVRMRPQVQQIDEDFEEPLDDFDDGGDRPKRKQKLVPTLTAFGLQNHWKFLKDCYRDEPNPDIREKGWELWLKYNRAAAKGAHGGKPFPEEWLPAEVRERRSNGGVKPRVEFEAPALPKRKAKQTTAAS